MWETNTYTYTQTDTENRKNINSFAQKYRSKTSEEGDRNEEIQRWKKRDTVREIHAENTHKVRDRQIETERQKDRRRETET